MFAGSAKVGGHCANKFPCCLQLIPGTTDSYRYNYWGYSTAGFFAPMSRYSQAAAEGRPGQQVLDEFKTMVKECHKRGIEVLMDVVFNHTAEGNERGPTLSFRCCLPREDCLWFQSCPLCCAGTTQIYWLLSNIKLIFPNMLAVNKTILTVAPSVHTLMRRKTSCCI